MGALAKRHNVRVRGCGFDCHIWPRMHRDSAYVQQMWTFNRCERICLDPKGSETCHISIVSLVVLLPSLHKHSELQELHCYAIIHSMLLEYFFHVRSSNISSRFM